MSSVCYHYHKPSFIINSTATETKLSLIWFRLIDQFLLQSNIIRGWWVGEAVAREANDTRGVSSSWLCEIRRVWVGYWYEDCLFGIACRELCAIYKRPGSQDATNSLWWPNGIGFPAQVSELKHVGLSGSLYVFVCYFYLETSFTTTAFTPIALIQSANR